jgi:hypothetical protein
MLSHLQERAIVLPQSDWSGNQADSNRLLRQPLYFFQILANPLNNQRPKAKLCLA